MQKPVEDVPQKILLESPQRSVPTRRGRGASAESGVSHPTNPCSAYGATPDSADVPRPRRVGTLLWGLSRRISWALSASILGKPQVSQVPVSFREPWRDEQTWPVCRRQLESLQKIADQLQMELE